MVGFNAVLTSEHFASFLVFGILHAALAIIYIKVESSLHKAQHSLPKKAQFLLACAVDPPTQASHFRDRHRKCSKMGNYCG